MEIFQEKVIKTKEIKNYKIMKETFNYLKSYVSDLYLEDLIDTNEFLKRMDFITENEKDS